MMGRDRRAQRTQELLQKALIDLVKDRSYEGIRIQDIVDRAAVGRTTFYLHYKNKDDLFDSCHEAVLSEFRFGPHYSVSREELLSPEASPAMISVYRHLEDSRPMLRPIFQGSNGPQILRRIRDRTSLETEARLRTMFGEINSTIPLELLAKYLVGAQIALAQWWLEKRQPYSADDIAQAFHRLQRAAICDAFGLRLDE